MKNPLRNEPEARYETNPSPFARPGHVEPERQCAESRMHVGRHLTAIASGVLRANSRVGLSWLRGFNQREFDTEK
jgi:hypothetical protein